MSTANLKENLAISTCYISYYPTVSLLGVKQRQIGRCKQEACTRITTEAFWQQQNFEKIYICMCIYAHIHICISMYFKKWTLIKEWLNKYLIASRERWGLRVFLVKRIFNLIFTILMLHQENLFMYYMSN